MTRFARLFALVMLAAATSGCATMPALQTMTSQGAPAPTGAAGSDLDSYIYARATDRPLAAHAVVAVPAAGVAAIPANPAAAFAGEPPYRLDSGDRLRIMVFGQDGLTNSYIVDASGAITMPLIKSVAARGLTTEELARTVAERLRRGFIREPHVAIEVETYRPFFILGEVTTPGQYAYVPHMTAENAIAIAGGFTPRAYRGEIKLDRPATGGVIRNTVPLLTRIRPGDTIIVKERWF